MIISLGLFPFKAANIVNLNEKTAPSFSEFAIIDQSPHYHNTNGSTATKTIQGVYIADSNSKPSILKEIAQAKEPIRLTLMSGQSVKVIITNFTTDKKNFLPWAGAVKIDFQIEVTEVEHELSLAGILYGLI